MRNDRFKKKFFEKLNKVPRESEFEEAEKMEPRGPRCFECSRFGHILADCGNFKQEKGKAYSEHSDEDGKELKKAYKTLYVQFEKLREAHKQHIHELKQFTDRKKPTATQDTETRGEATGDTTTVGEGHR